MDCHGPGTRLLVCIYLLIYVWIYVWLIYIWIFTHNWIFLGYWKSVGPQPPSYLWWEIWCLSLPPKSQRRLWSLPLCSASDFSRTPALTRVSSPMLLASAPPRDSNTNLLFAPLLQNPLTLNSGVYSKLCALLGAKDSVTAEQTTWNWMLGVPDLRRISGHPSWLIPPFTPQLWDRAALPSKWHGAPV